MAAAAERRMGDYIIGPTLGSGLQGKYVAFGTMCGCRASCLRYGLSCVIVAPG